MSEDNAVLPAIGKAAETVSKFWTYLGDYPEFVVGARAIEPVDEGLADEGTHLLVFRGEGAIAIGYWYLAMVSVERAHMPKR